MNEQLGKGLAAQVAEARNRLVTLRPGERLPKGLDPDYYLARARGHRVRKPVQQDTIFNVKALIASDGGADYD